MDLNVERWCSMKEIANTSASARDTVLAWIEKEKCRHENRQAVEI